MPSDLESTSSITIDAPASKVWEALTSPELIRRWFFGVDTVTDWKVGSSIVHRGEYGGKPYEDRGTIVSYEPPSLLVHTHWSPVSGLADEPENYQLVTWSLNDVGGRTELIIHEVNLPSEETKAVSEQSWSIVLKALKDLLEGRPLTPT